SDNTLPASRAAGANCTLVDAVRENGLSILRWTNTVEAFRSRISFLNAMEGESWPDVSDEALLARLDDWLLPYLKGEPDPASLSPEALQEALKSLLPYDLQREINKFAPSHFTAPTGSRV